MELVLRYIGPIAVGVNGASHSFLHYSGGIFDDPTCKKGANHALLITGYGEEIADNGKKTKFWYARNSWGTGWGENGYVRVKRGRGKKGEPGVCGIARSPSVALGGILLPKSLQLLAKDGLSLAMDGTREERFCADLGLKSNNGCLRTVNWIANHKALSAGAFGGLFGIFAVIMLLGDCRRRRRLQRILQQKREVERERLRRSMLGLEDAEAAALLADAERESSYGAAGETQNEKPEN